LGTFFKWLAQYLLSHPEVVEVVVDAVKTNKGKKKSA
jgi:hypothetical protein